MKIELTQEYTRDIMTSYYDMVVSTVPIEKRELAYNILATHHNLTWEERTEKYVGWDVGAYRGAEYLDCYKFLRYSSQSELKDRLLSVIAECQAWRNLDQAEREYCFKSSGVFNPQALKLEDRENEIRIEVANNVLKLMEEV